MINDFIQRNRAVSTALIIFILASIILIGLTQANLAFSKSNPGGNDFLVHWMGTRVFLKEGISPYSDETAIAIQTMAYGRPAGSGEHELRVAYPLYSILLFLPFALIPDFHTARAIWMTVLEAGLISLAWMTIRLAGWKIGRGMLVVFLIFSILWYHSLRPLINGNAIILVALMIAGALLAIKYRADELAGVLLAFSTIKPHVVLLIIVYILFWTARQRRWRVWIWFGSVLLLLMMGAGLLMPDWILQNLREILRYPGYNPPGTLASALTAMLPGLGERLKYAIAGVGSLVLLSEWGLSRKAEFPGFLWTACLTLVISQWIGIQTDPGNFILLYPCLVVIFSVWEKRWLSGGRFFSIITLTSLFFGIWAIFLSTVGGGDQPQQSPIMFLPFPAFLIIFLYWIKWWANQLLSSTPANPFPLRNDPGI